MDAGGVQIAAGGLTVHGGLTIASGALSMPNKVRWPIPSPPSVDILGSQIHIETTTPVDVLHADSCRRDSHVTPLCIALCLIVQALAVGALAARAEGPAAHTLLSLGSDSSQYAGRVIDLAVPGDGAPGAAGGAFSFITARRGTPDHPDTDSTAGAGAGASGGGKKEAGEVVFKVAADGGVKV